MIGGIALAARQGSDANGGIDTLTAIENVIGAVDQANYINGSSDANTITGGSKNDYLRGGAGNDTVNGGAGDDTLVGGAGADVLNGGDGIDTVDYSADPFTSDSYGDRQVIVNLSGKTIQALGLNVGAGYARDNFGGGPADYLTNIENVVGVTGRTNYLVGSDGANILVGGTQADTILGGLGNDTLLGNAGADNLSGEGGNDSLIGGDGHDTLNGGDGNDSLQGGSGNDMLIGGAGNDKFIYADGVTGSDIIADCTAGDVLAFSSSIFSNVNDLKAHMPEVNGNTVITLDQTSMITLSNTLLITNWKEANFQII